MMKILIIDQPVDPSHAYQWNAMAKKFVPMGPISSGGVLSKEEQDQLFLVRSDPGHLEGNKNFLYQKYLFACTPI